MTTELNLTREQRAALRAAWPARHPTAEAADHVVRLALLAPTDEAALAAARAAFSPVTRVSKVDGLGGLVMAAAVRAASLAAAAAAPGSRRDRAAELGVTLQPGQAAALAARLGWLARALSVRVVTLADLRALEAASPARRARLDPDATRTRAEPAR
jgi:hypothetical protein